MSEAEKETVLNRVNTLFNKLRGLKGSERSPIIADINNALIDFAKRADQVLAGEPVEPRPVSKAEKARAAEIQREQEDEAARQLAIQIARANLRENAEREAKSKVVTVSDTPSAASPPAVKTPSSASSVSAASRAATNIASSTPDKEVFEGATTEHGIGNIPSVKVFAPPGGKTSIQIGVVEDDNKVDIYTGAPNEVPANIRKKISEVVPSKGKLKDVFKIFAQNENRISIEKFQEGLEKMGIKITVDQAKWSVQKASGGQLSLGYSDFVKAVQA